MKKDPLKLKKILIKGRQVYLTFTTAGKFCLSHSVSLFQSLNFVSCGNDSVFLRELLFYTRFSGVIYEREDYLSGEREISGLSCPSWMSFGDFSPVACNLTKHGGPAHCQLLFCSLPSLCSFCSSRRKSLFSQKPLLPEDIRNPKDTGRPHSTELYRGQY